MAELGNTLPRPWRPAPRRDDDGLSAVERDTLVRLAEGATIDDVARVNGLTRSGAKARLHLLYVALGVENRRDALAVAAERGLITKPADGEVTRG